MAGAYGPAQSSDTPHGPRGPYQELVARIARYKREADEKYNHLLKAAGISLDENGMTIDSALILTGTLSLPAGIIDNDALANPVEIRSAGTFVSGFAITPTPTVFATVSMAVPMGFTRAAVALVGTGMGFNNSGAIDWLYVASTLTGSPGGTEVYTGVGVGGGTSIASPCFSTVEGLTPGSNLVLGVQMHSGANTWTASTGNAARIDAQATFLR